MTPMLAGTLAAQRRTVDLDDAAAMRLWLDLRRRRSTRAAVTRAGVRLHHAMARREAQESPRVTVGALAP